MSTDKSGKTKPCYCGVEGCIGTNDWSCDCAYTTNDDGIHFCHLHRSVNPERDKLARELATRLLDGTCPCTCMTCRLNIKKARQLLKLYEED
ncbi:hypothetical protein LCGC14_2681610 [marine sediment metagenome]|uniref:Uncharacterized protein n=1 Tax=marine sediment metagenome TaxID=412755 RepID=A0A0F8ZL66_9ZZZZ